MSDEGFAEHVGLTFEESSNGLGEVSLQVGDQHRNRHGTVHGGCIVTMIDVAMGRAVASVLDADQKPVTIEMKVNFLEPGEHGRLVATAVVRKQGRRFTVIEAEVHDDAGDVIALATGTFAPTVH